jgi:molybdenum cofactor cytidylyltransferase
MHTMSRQQAIAAVILAAGRSARMGVLKPLLPLEGETIMERVVGLFRGAGISDILVVVGNESVRLAPVLEKMAVRYVVNEDYQHGMFSSVQAGVKHLGEGYRAFFLHPVDIPLIRGDTLKKLMAVFREERVDICRPCYQGKRGHPPLIAATLIPHILTYAGPGGLRALLSRHTEHSLDVECDDPGVLMDMNTPENYEKIKKAIVESPSIFHKPSHL